MARETTGDGVWTVNASASKIDLIDAINANLAMLGAMTNAILGNGLEAFEMQTTDSKACYLMAMEQKIEHTKILALALAE